MKTHNAYSIRWTNFKGFADTDWIKIRPVTLLIGPNNSGKSNLIAPLLLMSQTLASRDSSSPLHTQGALYDSGTSSQLFHNCDYRNDLTLSFNYHMHSLPANKKIRPIGTFPPGAFEVVFGLDKLRGPGNELFVKKEIVSDIYGRPFFEATRNAQNEFSFKTKLGKFKKAEADRIGKAEPTNFLFSSQGILSALTDETNGPIETAVRSDFSKAYSKLLSATSYNFNIALDILGDLSFLGPLRDAPKRFYRVTGGPSNSVGHRGEKLASVLHTHLPIIRKQLNKWIKLFGFGDRIDFRALSNDSDIYEIGFWENSRKRSTNIADAGFGASQLLPLLVQALVPPDATLTIAEQPEIHLNPRLQVLLADVFAHMAKRKQLAIIETHSEHLFLALRRLVARGDLAAEDLAVYFIEKQDGISSVKEIDITEKGGLSNKDWPIGFFGEALEQSLDLAQLQFKNRK